MFIHDIATNDNRNFTINFGPFFQDAFNKHPDCEHLAAIKSDILNVVNEVSGKVIDDMVNQKFVPFREDGQLSFYLVRAVEDYYLKVNPRGIVNHFFELYGEVVDKDVRDLLYCEMISERYASAFSTGMSITRLCDELKQARHCLGTIDDAITLDAGVTVTLHKGDGVKLNSLSIANALVEERDLLRKKVLSLCDAIDKLYAELPLTHRT